MLNPIILECSNPHNPHQAGEGKYLTLSDENRTSSSRPLHLLAYTTRYIRSAFNSTRQREVIWVGHRCSYISIIATVIIVIHRCAVVRAITVGPIFLRALRPRIPRNDSSRTCVPRRACIDTTRGIDDGRP